MANRLGAELSPYLQQHAHNPVDWYPWGEEALTRARNEDLPILLSIGYSACHWCHVMERESFDDEVIAAQMNASFVNIKVDREERPDLDKIYQTAVQLMTRRSGGWPLTVFLTPSLEPFYGGTYFPPADRHGMPGLPRILQSVAEAYRTRGEEIESIGSEVLGAIRSLDDDQGRAPVDSESVLSATRSLALRFDDRYGGFGDAPKFPNTLSLEAMLRAHRSTGDETWLSRVRQAVDAMIDGGIHDQLGGGFHRYSTDARWRVPHFEKMLYDNALIARLLVDLWRVTKDARYRRVCESLLAYVEREMSAEDGGFFATQDADSEAREGAFFVWSPDTLVEVLGSEDGDLAARAFGVDEAGNFEAGESVLHRARTPASLAAQRGEAADIVAKRLEGIRKKLFETRELRPKPFRDEKIVTAWNGWMAGAFAQAGAAFDEPRFVARAEAALRFLEDELFSEGRLARVSKGGRHEGRGFLVDYAASANAALDLYEATFDERWSSFATELVDAAVTKFWDEERGLLFFAEPTDDLVLRSEDNIDGEVPAASTEMLTALLRLDGLVANPVYGRIADEVLQRRASTIGDNPGAFAGLIGVVDRWVRGSTHIVVVNRARDPAITSLADVARATFVPNRVLANAHDGDSDGLPTTPSRPGVYVCQDRTCSAVILDADALREALGEPPGSTCADGANS